LVIGHRDRKILRPLACESPPQPTGCTRLLDQ
jgi:hypothetical protein